MNGGRGRVSVTQRSLPRGLNRIEIGIVFLRLRGESVKRVGQNGDRGDVSATGKSLLRRSDRMENGVVFL